MRKQIALVMSFALVACTSAPKRGPSSEQYLPVDFSSDRHSIVALYQSSQKNETLVVINDQKTKTAFVAFCPSPKDVKKSEITIKDLSMCIEVAGTRIPNDERSADLVNASLSYQFRQAFESDFKRHLDHVSGVDIGVPIVMGAFGGIMASWFPAFRAAYVGQSIIEAAGKPALIVGAIIAAAGIAYALAPPANPNASMEEAAKATLDKVKNLKDAQREDVAKYLDGYIYDTFKRALVRSFSLVNEA